jgi:organic radical activating enzyme
MSSTKTYPIHERFNTFQGEGVHMGKHAFFIRTFGCPLHCPWCDSAGTWHPEFVPKHVGRLSAEQLVAEAVASRAKIVVVTGGEPTIHDLSELTQGLHRHGLRVHLETSGAFDIQGCFDWITLSPKRSKLPLGYNLRIADEFKFIIESPADIQYWSDVVDEAGPHVEHPDGARPRWLHPEWSKRSDAGILNAITEAVKGKGAPYRAGWQMHKLYRADLLDPRAEVGVPLGGNQTLGY